MVLECKCEAAGPAGTGTSLKSTAWGWTHLWGTACQKTAVFVWTFHALKQNLRCCSRILFQILTGWSHLGWAMVFYLQVHKVWSMVLNQDELFLSIPGICLCVRLLTVFVQCLVWEETCSDGSPKCCWHPEKINKPKERPEIIYTVPTHILVMTS